MTTQEVIKTCINKELELYDTNINTVESLIDSGFFNDDIPWYSYYTFNTKEEYASWKEFCINLFRKELKLSKAKAEKEFIWFDLNYGLKQNYELDK